MAVKYCPECRHEIAGRGRYCMFCGCDLRKTRPVAVPAGQQENRAAAAVREPEEAGSQKTSAVRKVIAIAVLALLIAMVGVGLLAYTGISSRKEESPVLQAGMSFAEAARAVERCGFVKDGEDTEKSGKHTRKYKSREVYGYETRYTILETEEGKNGRVSLTHYYSDTQGSGTESWKFQQIANRMRERYGRPNQMKDIVEGYSWSDGNGGHMLYSIAGMIVLSQWQSD